MSKDKGDRADGLWALILMGVLAAWHGSLAHGQDASSEAGATSPKFDIEPAQIVTREQMHRFERHVRGFRREHNFALSAGLSSGVWNVQWADAERRGYDNSGLYTRFQYSFHMPFYKGFGYMLGSGTGYHHETADRRREFRPVPAVQFPGLLLGLVMNFNSVVRAALAVEAYLERHGGIEDRRDPGATREVHVTLQAYDASVAIDVFYDLTWGLRIEGHRRSLEYLRPKDASGFAVDARLYKTDTWLGVGFVHHLL